MPQSKLTDDQKLHIGQTFSSSPEWTQDKLAKMYGVSRRTIARCLQELDLLEKPNVLGPGSARIVEVVRSLGLNEHTLYQALNQPVLSRDNMIALLAAMKLEDIEALFADVVQRKHQNNHGTVPNDSALAQPPAAGSPEDAAVPHV